MIEFAFDASPWELAMAALHPGDSISAVRCMTLLSDMSEEEAEEALLTLEERGITLQISDLPKSYDGGEAAVRLQLEQRLVKNGQLLEGLDKNDPLKLYLMELASVPAFGDANLLAQRYASGDDSVAQQLVNLYLNGAVTRACAMTGWGVLLLDLIQEASLGLWQGVLNYTGGDFEKHVCWWMDQYLAKAVLMQARSSDIGQKMRQGMEDFRDMDQKLLGELGRNPTLEEIAEAIHVTVEEAATYEAVLTQAKARQQVEQARAPKEETPDDSQAVEDTAYFQTRQRILDMLSTLTQQEANVLKFRFGLEGGLPMTPQQTGEKMGLSADEVVNIEAAALIKLRQQEA